MAFWRQWLREDLNCNCDLIVCVSGFVAGWLVSYLRTSFLLVSPSYAIFLSSHDTWPWPYHIFLKWPAKLNLCWREGEEREKRKYKLWKMEYWLLQDICTQGSEPVKVLPYMAEGDFISIVVSTDLEMERLAKLSGQVSCNYWVAKSGEPFPAMVRGRQDHGRRSRDMPLLALKEEEGDHKPKNVGNSRRWKRQESKFFHRASRNASSLTTTLILMQWYLPQTSSPQKCKETNLCYLSH